MNTGEHRAKRFGVDIMLGKLAKWLRVLGFDARMLSLGDPASMEPLLTESRIPVTRRAKFRDAEGVVFIRSDHYLDQLRELTGSLQIADEDLRPFSRCSVCNAELLPIPRQETLGFVPDYVFETASDFHKCPRCAKIYWPGTHRQKMMENLKALGFSVPGVIE